MKRCHIITLVIFLALAFAGCRGGEQAAPVAGKAAPAPEKVVITIDFPLTGNIAYYGEVVSRGAQLAVDRYNAARKPGEPEVVLKLEDNFGNVQEAVKVFNKAVDQDRAVAVLSLFTPHSTALLPLSAGRKVVLYATVTSVVEFGVKSPFAFRDYISLPQQGKKMADYLHGAAKVSTVGSLVVNDDYGLDAARLVKEEFLRLGGKWVIEEAFEQKDIDIRDPVTKVVAAKPDAIFMCGRELSLANAVRQTRELGYQGLIVANNGFDTPTVFKAVGEAGTGVVFTSAAFDVASPASDQQAAFIKEYRERFNQEPDYNAAHGYTIGQALCSAIRQEGRDTEKLRAYLQGYEVDDILGKGKMTESRDVSREVALYRLENGVRLALKAN